MENLSPLIQGHELLNIGSSNDLLILDARTGKDALHNYVQQHLAGALHVDLNTQLADIKPDAAMGGRHPLPSAAQFSETLGKLGIRPQSHVIIYDDQNGANAAARLWWMLRSAGHTMVQVLNGGLKSAIKAGFSTDNTVPTPLPTQAYPFEKWLLPVSDMASVNEASRDKQFLVIDVRSADRYLGKTEPIDLVAGHIPGAVNIPFTDNLDEHGEFLSPGLLKHKYSSAFENRPSENIIVHCGSGVTACHTLLAIAYAGLPVPNLYVGSWSEWSRSNNEIATGFSK